MMHELLNQIEADLQTLSTEFESYQMAPDQGRQEKIQALIQQKIKTLPAREQNRVQAEFHGDGPLGELFQQADITEILVNGPFDIWFERNGRLQRYDDRFASRNSFRNYCFRLMEEARVQLTSEHPTAHGHLRQFRLHMIGGELTGSQVHLSFRRHPENPWTFEKLSANGWGQEDQIQEIQRIVDSHLNFLVVGGTGTGKTSVLNACLQRLPENERAVLIEDTLELKVPNPASMRLLTREDPNGILKKVDQTELVRNALRLRPDRLVMGEIRGDEAKDFLMALATGHAGSFGTLHAATAAQALIRLEMLVQIGAPNWSLSAVRRLIQMSLQAIVVIGRNEKGERLLEGVYRVSSLEENGLLLEKIR